MQWGRTPCDGVVLPGKCAACNLARLGMPRPAARFISLVPPGAANVLRQLPGRLGTSLGMTASVVELSAMQRELFDLVERFVVLNETARRMLVANGSPERKLVVNRLGLSLANVVRKPGPDVAPTRTPVRFGYVGRLHPSKGLSELVRAVRATPADAPFVVEIRGPRIDAAARAYVDKLRTIAEGDPRVVFADGVAQSGMPDVLSQIDALLCPSTWFENGPTVALEANAVGTPVIASGVGNLAEIVIDGVNGRLVPPGDVAAWARALEEAARQPVSTIDRWRRAIVPPRTMDEIARDYLALYAA